MTLKWLQGDPRLIKILPLIIPAVVLQSCLVYSPFTSPKPEQAELQLLIEQMERHPSIINPALAGPPLNLSPVPPVQTKSSHPQMHVHSR
jgi:hypothetical protein